MPVIVVVDGAIVNAWSVAAALLTVTESGVILGIRSDRAPLPSSVPERDASPSCGVSILKSVIAAQPVR